MFLIVCWNGCLKLKREINRLEKYASFIRYKDTQWSDWFNGYCMVQGIINKII